MLTVSPSTCRYVSPYAPLSQCPASSRAVAGAPATVGNVVAAGAVGPGGVTLEAEPGSAADAPHPAAEATRASVIVKGSNVRACTSSVSFTGVDQWCGLRRRYGAEPLRTMRIRRKSRQNTGCTDAHDE